jgi:hypothetical protein
MAAVASAMVAQATMRSGPYTRYFPATVGLSVDDEQTGLVDDGEGFKHVVRQSCQLWDARRSMPHIAWLAGLERPQQKA